MCNILKNGDKLIGGKPFLLSGLLILLLIAPIFSVSAQNSKFDISGVVTDSQGAPLIGVAVTIEESNLGASTDLDGKFSLSVGLGDVLNCSYIGFADERIVITNKRQLTIVMSEEATSLDEVVVVGYGAQKKASVVAAIVQVKAEDIKTRGVVSNMSDALSGSMPGVNVMTSTGMPGGLTGEYDDAGYTKSTSILIRGMSTWNDASPLILVDGMERNMNDIDINEVETFSVLKDASATAVYGVRGANGVILITTKRGTKGKAQVSVEVNYSMKSLSNVEPVVGSYDALLARNYAVLNSLPNGDGRWGSLYYPKSLLTNYRDGVDPEKWTDTNMQDFILKDFTHSNKYSVNVTGGTDFVQYFSSASYLYDGDILDGNTAGEYPTDFHYERFNFRTNLDFNLTETTKFSVNLSGYVGNQYTVPYQQNSLWYSIYKHAPDAPLPIYSDGTYGSDAVLGGTSVGYNGYAGLSDSGTAVYNRISTTSDFSLEQDLGFVVKGLTFSGRFSYDNYFTTTGRDYRGGTSSDTKYYNVLTNEWVYQEGTRDFENGFPDDERVTLSYEDASSGSSSAMRNLYYTFSFNYNTVIAEKHTIGALALFSRSSYATGDGFPATREDWVGRVTYDYDGRYLAEVNAAYNGSDKFGNNYKFDLFPSLALGWRLSEEQFIKDLSFISNLKAKYSIGLSGSDNMSFSSQWPYVTTYVDGSTVSYREMAHPIFGGPLYTDYETATNTYIESTPGNEDLHWEKSLKQNFGLELGLFDNQITVEADYFKEHRYDILLSGGERTMPEYFGTTAPAANIGIVNSSGMELLINMRRKIGEVNVWGSYNWTVAKNKIIYKEDPAMQEDYLKSEGYSIEQNTTSVVTDIYGSWNDVFLYTLSNDVSDRKQTVPGDYAFLDYNGDGVISTLDVVPYGHTRYPSNTYGFSFGAEYKNLSFSMQFNGAYNVNQSFSAMSEMDYAAAVIYQSQLDVTATPEYGVSDATYRSIALNTGRNTGLGNSLLYDGSFLRLKTMEVAYTIPKKHLDKLGISSIRIFLNGNNIFYWSDLPADIEGADYSMRNYPTTKLVNIGANLTF